MILDSMPTGSDLHARVRIIVSLQAQRNGNSGAAVFIRTSLKNDSHCA
jgi:hypothetical protein